MLDVGCHYGSFLHNLIESGYTNSYGIDVREHAIERGLQYYPELKNRVLHYDGSKLPYDDNSYDALTMFDVIEHIPDVDRFLKEEVFRVLKPGGLFIYQTPNKITNIPWEIVNQRSFTKWRSYHCSLQTLPSLKRLLQKAEFSEIKVEKFNVLTDHNKARVREKAGFIGTALLYTVNYVPLPLFTNFWGTAVKP